MSPEKLSFRDKLHDKRSAFAVVLGISVLATAGCSVQSERSVPSPTPNYSIEQPHHAQHLPETDMLKNYEKEVGVEPKMMDFIPFPHDEASAREQATDLSKTLLTWHDNGISPIIILEPNFDEKTQMDLPSFAEGKYDTTITTFFSTLKAEGIDDEMLGTVVPFPEPNIPEWKNGITDPTIFVQNTTKVAKSLRQYFPHAQVSVMLDSVTYPDHDIEESHGSSAAAALLPYLHFEPGLIDSFGYQGFTWNDRDEPADYLNADTAITAAKTLGVKRVWFNTGTFSKTFDSSKPAVPLTEPEDRRAKVLDGVLHQALRVKQADMSIDINIFGQNTYTGHEGTDYQYRSPQDLQTLKTFVDHAKEHNIPVTIFDASN